jgi:membrane fusion protein, multidrug efflux system
MNKRLGLITINLTMINKHIILWMLGLLLFSQPSYAESPDDIIKRIMADENLGAPTLSDTTITPTGDALPPSGDEIRFLLRPMQSAILSAQMNGTITELALLPGSKFKKGDRLFKQECRVYEAEQEIHKEEVNIQKTKYETSRTLMNRNSVGKVEYLVNKYTYQKAVAQAKAATVRRDLCEVTAPFSGKVAKVLAQRYEHIQEGKPVLEIFDDGAFELHMIVPSHWLKWIKPYTTFMVRIDETGTLHRAEVKRIEPRIDSVSKTVPIVGVLVDEPEVSYYGMSGTAYFTANEATPPEKP